LIFSYKWAKKERHGYSVIVRQLREEKKLSQGISKKRNEAAGCYISALKMAPHRPFDRDAGENWRAA